MEKGEEEANVVYNSVDRKEEVEVLDQDIRFIHLNGLSLIKADEQFYGSFGFYSILLLLLLLLILLYFLSRRYKEKQADIVGLRKGKAKKLAIKRMGKAKKLLDQLAYSEFYEEVSRALYGYFADRYNMGVAELSQEQLREKLNSENASEQLIALLSDSIDQAEMAKYAPSSAVDPQRLYENAKTIIIETEALRS